MSSTDLMEKVYVKRGFEVAVEKDKFYIQAGENEIYELSPAVYYVWRLNDGEKTVGDIIKHASKELEIEEEKLKQPIIEIIEKLAEANLIYEAKK